MCKAYKISCNKCKKVGHYGQNCKKGLDQITNVESQELVDKNSGLRSSSNKSSYYQIKETATVSALQQHVYGGDKRVRQYVSPHPIVI